MPPKPSKPTPTKSTNEIFKDPANDILLCSSDNVTFPFRKLHLESASEVFEGMLSVGREGPRKKRRFDSDALEVVDLAEEANLLEKYLIFLHPRVEDPDIVEFEELEQLVAIADKYASRSALIAMLVQGIWFLPDHAPALFALGLIYEPPLLAGKALRAFGYTDRHGHHDLRYEVQAIPHHLFERLPHYMLHYLFSRQADINDEDIDIESWDGDAAILEDAPTDWRSDKEKLLTLIEEHQHAGPHVCPRVIVKLR